MEPLKLILIGYLALLTFYGLIGEELTSVNQKTKPPEKEFKILFLGDTCFGECYRNYMKQRDIENIFNSGGYDYCGKKLLPLLEGNNLIIANLETPISDLKVSPFTGKKNYLNQGDIYKTPVILKKFKFAAVSLANNHVLDYGHEGLSQTREILRKNDILFLGAGDNEKNAARPLSFKFSLNGRPFNLIIAAGFEHRINYEKSFHYYATPNNSGVNSWEIGKAMMQIREIRKNNPEAFIVAYPHWGENYTAVSKQQKDLAHALIEMGADLIIGHGAHMAQGIEKYHGRWIIYSLGNFIFNSPGRYAIRKVAPLSMAAKLIVTEENDNFTYLLKLYPIYSNNLISNYQPYLLSELEMPIAREIILRRSQAGKAIKNNLRVGKDNTGNFFQIDVTPSEKF